MDSEIIIIGSFFSLVVILLIQQHKANRESDIKKQLYEFSRLVRVVEKWIEEHPYLCLPHPAVQEEINCAYAYAWWLTTHYPEIADNDWKIKHVLREYSQYVAPPQKAFD